MRIPEERHPEPEIIPPGQPDPRRSQGGPRLWVWVEGRQGDRLQWRRPGALAIALAALAVGLLFALGLFLALGLLLILMPLAGALILAAILARFLRGRQPPAPLG